MRMLKRVYSFDSDHFFIFFATVAAAVERERERKLTFEVR